MYRFTNTSSANGVLRVRNVHGAPLHGGRYIQVGHRLGLVEAYICRKSALGVVDVAFCACHAEAHHGAALDLGGEALGVEYGAAVSDGDVLDLSLIHI